MTDDEIRARYRITDSSSWRLETCVGGIWQVAFFCSSEESARKCMERQIVRFKKWLALTDEERMKEILR